MKPLIVPVNFSESAANAAKYAGDMALAIHADVHLIHVMQLPVSVAEAPLTEELYTEMKQNGEEELQKIKKSIERDTSCKVNVYTHLEIGTVEHEIEEICKKKNPFAVLMGIKKNSTDRFLFGSNATFALKHLHYPLLVIPERTKFHAIKKIILACDLNVANQNIPVDFLKELQHIFHASFGVLNIDREMTDDLSSKKEFVSLKNLLKGLYPAYYLRIADTPEEGINKFLKEDGADLMLLLPKQHNFFEFHKSKAKQIMLKTDVPVMAIHE